MDIIQDYICLDIETTGRAEKDIIELAAVRVRNGVIVDQIQELVKPKCRIPKNIIALTGISNEDVADCRSIKNALPDFVHFIGNDILVGHNIKSFDFPIISAEYERISGLVLENELIDTLTLSREIPLQSHTLAQMCDYYGIENKTAHRALSDVLATNELFQNLLRGIRNDNYVEKPISEHNTFTYRNSYNAQTLAIQELNNLLCEAVSDNSIEINEVMAISDWANKHQELQGNFPFDLIKDEISAVIDNGLFSHSDLRRLCAVFLYAMDPITNPSPFSAKFTYTTPPIYESNVCITGEFSRGERSEIEQMITDSGATLCDHVTKKLNYLVVGSHGSELWSEGNYGNKIKKVLEYQRNNVPINILSEDAFFHRLQEEKAEQITFNELGDDFSSLQSRLATLVENCKEKYNYYKIHRSGSYEMEYASELSPEDMVDILELSVNQNGNVFSLKIFGQTVVKIERKKGYSVHISQKAYQKLSFDSEFSDSSVKNYIKVDVQDIDDVMEICCKCYDYEICNFIPVSRFGCCSQYRECAKHNKCLHINQFYAKGCYWRERIEK